MRVPRVVSLLLLTYLFLDIANPMMPGAVQFVDGTIQVVQADRARPDADRPILAVRVRGRMIVTPDRSLTPMRRLRHVFPLATAPSPVSVPIPRTESRHPQRHRTGVRQQARVPMIDAPAHRQTEARLHRS